MTSYTHSDSPQHEPGTLPMCAGCEAMLVQLGEQVAEAHLVLSELEDEETAMRRRLHPPPPIDPESGWAYVLRARYS